MLTSRSRLLALARKYRTLSALRRGTLAFSADELRLLAREFPGALRELDSLPLDVLDERQAEVERALSAGATELWIESMLAYHARMRQALAIKRRLLGERTPGVELLRRVARAVSEEFLEPCDPGFVRRVAAPPGGRLNWLVFEVLENEIGQPSYVIERLLFPSVRH